MGAASERPDKIPAPSVAIDGARIRSVREAKKLTQLYVASVVGVTTDTISRWENNRYPSIKRENAEKLASALEVELGEILRQEEVSETSEAEPTPPSLSVRSARLMLLSGLAALALIFVATLMYSRRPVPTPTAVRWLPRFAAPGEIIPVQIKVTQKSGENLGFILKERFPGGLRLINTAPASSAAETSGSGVKWLIPGGSTSTTVSYTVQIPTSSALRNETKLEGEVVVAAGVTNRTEAVGGSSSIKIGPYHWADGNADGRIDDDEIMPAYYVCEEMKGLGLDWKTIEAIWSGKGYRWDARSGFSIVK